MKKRLLSIVLALVLCLSLLPVTALAAMMGSGTESNPYQIATAEDLVEFAESVNDGKTYDGEYVVLTNNIDLSGIEWTPIGAEYEEYDYYFSGTFDGQGYTISGLTVTMDQGYLYDVGLFGNLYNATVKNVNLKGVSIVADADNVGGICGMADGETLIDYCAVSGRVEGEDDIGGICGDADDEYCEIMYCSNSAIVVGNDDSDTDAVGGICGENDGYIGRCLNAGPVAGDANYSDVDDDEDDEIGGICGDNNGTITRCVNRGTITGTYLEDDTSTIGDDCDEIGGICGYNEGTIEHSYNTGKVAGDNDDDDEIGGICGYSTGEYSGDAVIRNCYNTGSVSGEDNIGGICGENSYDSYIYNCYNTGTVTGDDEVGGICGYAEDEIYNCYNVGDVTGDEYVGGIVGYNCCGGLRNAYSVGGVNGDTSVGGICGYNDNGDDDITNCFWDDFDDMLPGENDGYDRFASSCKPISDEEELLDKLNAWVYENEYDLDYSLRSWAILPDTNDGYPVFGEPIAEVNLNEIAQGFAENEDPAWTWLGLLGGAASGVPFADVLPADWYYDAVQFVYNEGLMTGTSYDKFDPHAAITRAQLVTILWRLEGSPMGVEPSGFSDNDLGSWYGYAVEWAAAFDIVEGADGKFSPNDPITREQLAAILYRYAKYKGYDVWSGQTGLDGFDDAAKVSDYAVEAMQWAVGEGLINGVGEQLQSQGTAVRAQAAAILMRFLSK